MDNLNLLEPGVTKVHCHFKPGVIKEVLGSNRITVQLDEGNVIPASLESIFLPSEHIITVSEIVLEKHTEFENNILVKNRVINPGISILFEKHWKAMCNTENKQKDYKQAMEDYYQFVNKLSIALDDAKNALLDNVPFFNIFPQITGID